MAIVPAAAERHYHQGILDEKDKLPEEAIAEYREAIKEYPAYTDARYRLANLLLDKGGYGEAISQYKEALNYKPNDATCITTWDSPTRKWVTGKPRKPSTGRRLDSTLSWLRRTATGATCLYARRDYAGAIVEYRGARPCNRIMRIST